MTNFWYLALPISYLLGAFPSSYLIAKLRGVDLNMEGDGKISAAAIYRRFNLPLYLLVLFLDICKGLLALYIVRTFISNNLIVLFICGVLIVIGHNWSPFLKFKGGMGATAMAGALAGLVFWPWLLIGLVCGVITMFITRYKSSISSAVILLVTSTALFIWPIYYPRWIGFYPLALGLLMALKALQKKRLATVNNQSSGQGNLKG